MKNTFLLSLQICLFILCLPVKAQFTLQNLQVAPPISYKNLQLYPILADSAFLENPKGAGTYATLETTLQNRQVQIAEQEIEGYPIAQSDRLWLMQNNYPVISGKNKLLETYTPVYSKPDVADTNASILYSPFDNEILDPEIVRLSQLEAQTNRLFITNLSNDTIYLMAGEVLQGGRQDRVIAQNMLLPPQSRNVCLPVFCVEKGRWDYHQDKNPCFTDYVCFADAQLRKTVLLHADQDAIWQVVNKTTPAQNAQNTTQTYAALNNNAAFTQLMDAYMGYLQPILQGNPHIVGVLAVSGNKISGADIFVTHRQFTNCLPNLLRSYAANAVLYGGTPQLVYKDVMAYLKQFITETGINRQALVNKGNVFEVNGQIIHLTLYE